MLQEQNLTFVGKEVSNRKEGEWVGKWVNRTDYVFIVCHSSNVELVHWA